MVDDGRGFDLDAVPPQRLGVRVSMLEASRRAGVQARLRTAPGRGTELVLGWNGRAAEPDRVVPAPTEAGERLPVDFPTGQLVAATWFAVAVSIGTGLATFGELRSPAAVAARHARRAGRHRPGPRPVRVPDAPRAGGRRRPDDAGRRSPA